MSKREVTISDKHVSMNQNMDNKEVQSGTMQHQIVMRTWQLKSES